jgi:hypothetical protein
MCALLEIYPGGRKQMLLIDVCKLVQVEAASPDDLIIVRKDFPKGYQVVTGSIKVKLATDMFVVVSPAQDADGNPILMVDILKSTSRKFQDNYVYDILKSKLIAADSNLMRFDKPSVVWN